MWLVCFGVDLDGGFVDRMLIVVVVVIWILFGDEWFGGGFVIWSGLGC